MNRFKFLVFALVTAGLWAYHVVVSGAAVVKAAEQATGTLVGAGSAVALRLEAQRSELEAALVQLSTSPAVWNLKVGVKEGPGADRFNAVRQVLSSVVSEANRPKLVVALLTEQGSLLAVGGAEPAAPPVGFDVVAASQGQAAGSIAVFEDVSYLFFATSLLAVDRNEVRSVGQVLAGLPLLPDTNRLEAVARELHLSTLAVIAQNKVLLAAGSEKVRADAALKALKVGQVTAIGSTPVRQVGPLSLPLFVESSSQWVGSRQVLAGTPFEVLAVVSLREPLEALAAYQLFGILALLGIVLLSVVVGFLIKSEDEGGTRMSLPPPLPMPPAKKEEPQLMSLAMGTSGHGPEGSPDDFHFPASSVSAGRAKEVLSSTPAPSSPQRAHDGPPALGGLNITQTAPPPPSVYAAAHGASEQPGPVWSSPPQTGAAPEHDPFATAAPSQPFASGRPSTPLPSFGLPPTGSSPAPSTLFAEGGDQRGPAYSAFAPEGDPFASSGPSSVSQVTASDDNPEATRVAVVPQELIKATRQGIPTGFGERPTAKISTEGLPKVQSVAPSADPEDRHHHEVFRDFVAAREKCGEPADGLTYERFKAKLLKNRDQLMSKYQCRTVRFQVYIKEGKAALKATPVKD